MSLSLYIYYIFKKEKKLKVLEDWPKVSWDKDSALAALHLPFLPLCLTVSKPTGDSRCPATVYSYG